MRISCSSSSASAVAATLRRASERKTSRVASSSGAAPVERRRRLQRSSRRWTGSPRSSSRRASGAVTITLRSCTSDFAADVDGAASGNEQEPQRLASLSGSRQRQRLARTSGASGADRIELVVLAAQPPLVPWQAANLEHGLVVFAQMTDQASAV